MNQDQIVDQAKFLFTTGRWIHEEILKIQSRHLAAKADFPNSELSMAQLHAIGVVRRQGPLAMGELAELLGISAPSASSMVDRLVEKGVLDRAHSTEDRRKVMVRISPTAVKDIEAMEAGVLRLFEDLVKKLGPETTRNWCHVLVSIQKVLLDESIAV